MRFECQALDWASGVGPGRRQAWGFFLGGWLGILGEEAGIAQADRDTDFR